MGEQHLCDLHLTHPEMAINLCTRSAVLGRRDYPSQDGSQAKKKDRIAGSSWHPSDIVEEDDEHSEAQETKHQHCYPGRRLIIGWRRLTMYRLPPFRGHAPTFDPTLLWTSHAEEDRPKPEDPPTSGRLACQE